MAEGEEKEKTWHVEKGEVKFGEKPDEPEPTESAGLESSNTGEEKKMPEYLSDSWLREYLAKSMGLRDPPKQLLETVDFSGIAKYIKDNLDKDLKIITMAGAGISTSAGIPDFRSPETGLYHNLQKYNLPDPMAIFSLDFFKENPEPFFMLAKELWPGVFKPTPCHYFLRMLQDKGVLLRHYTQNIDTLEMIAGLDPELVVEAHGSFRAAHCLECREYYAQEWMKEKIMTGKMPRCEKEDCDGIIKPDIVFFGENLPVRFAHCVTQDFQKCDLLIILGTSLAVQPFASLVNRVPDTTPRLSINMEKTGDGGNNPITILFFGGGLRFDAEDNYRDVFWEGKCDDGCYALADELGWGDEFRKLVETEHKKIDKESSPKTESTPAKSLPKTESTPAKSPPKTETTPAKSPPKTETTPAKSLAKATPSKAKAAEPEPAKATSKAKTPEPTKTPRKSATSKPGTTKEPTSKEKTSKASAGDTGDKANSRETADKSQSKI